VTHDLQTGRSTSHDRSPDVQIRRAVEADVAAIVDLLADDPLGAARETTTDLAPYIDAFKAIDADPSELLLVIADGDEVIGTMQLSFIPGLSRNGATRAQIEAVRVKKGRRSEGLGELLIERAIAEARRRGCAMVQLTTDKSRRDAHRFYERLGFAASHEGMKLTLFD
jgi:GNAT superfamily N-acetyltransferase